MNPNDKQWKEKKLNHYDNKILFDDNERMYLLLLTYFIHAHS